MEKYETFYVFLDWLQFNTCHKEIKQYVRQSKLDLYGNNRYNFDRNWKVYKKYKNLLEIIQKKRGKVSQVWWIVG
jgi:RNase P/RNase MRP subunit POP5